MAGKKEVAVGSEFSKSLTSDLSLKNQPVMVIRNISKRFRKKLVLRDVNFEIFHGDIFGIIGMSGSGKTTMFQLMSGLLKPHAGDILVRSDTIGKQGKNVPDYVSVLKNMDSIKRHFGFAAQQPSFYEHLTVEENILMYGSLYGIPKKKVSERLSRILHLVDLSHERDSIAAELSGGMQRRLDIACSLIHEPKVLFLDEPTSDLDPVMRKQIWNLIKEIHNSGTTVVIASHILEEVEALCTKVAILNDRKVIGYGTLKELKRLFQRNRQVKIEVESGNYDELMKRLRKEKDIERMLQKNHRLYIFIPNDSDVTKRIIKAVDACDENLLSLDVSDATLSEIFEVLMKKDQQEKG